MHTKPMDVSACRFGQFVVHPATRELWRANARVPLPAKSFDCIVYLLQHRDRAVGRDELIAAVWGRADVSDSVLSQTILHARRGLEDTGREQQVIRTVVGFGYHWVADVEVEDAMPRESPLAPTSQAHAAGPATDVPAGTRTTHLDALRNVAIPARARWPIAAAFAVLLIALASLGIWQLVDRRARQATPVPASVGTLIVLPVEAGGQHAAAWMRLGIMDLIAERLRGAGQNVVPSDRTVQLVQGFDTHDAGDRAALADAASASMILASDIAWRAGRWQVRLHSVFGRDPALVAKARADGPLDAARDAADAMARQLGLRPARADANHAGEPGLRELLQQVEAATLGDRLDVAAPCWSGRHRRNGTIPRYASDSPGSTCRRVDWMQPELRWPASPTR